MLSSIPRSDIVGMPMVGLGTSLLPLETTSSIISTAINLGYTHFDCAHIYKNEQQIGTALEHIKNRQDLFITSKLWSGDHTPDRVLPACKLTLRNLRLDYLDMYLIHLPFRLGPNNEPLYYKKEWIIETWREMVKLKESGMTRHIGVSNFTIKKLKWLMEEDETPENNQGKLFGIRVELHPYLPQHELVQFCKENGIVASAYAPLGSFNKKTPYVDTTAPGIPNILEDPLIGQIAKRHNASPAQILLKWNIRRGCPVLVKSTHEERMKENLKSLDINLTPHDLELIDKINIKRRYYNLKFFIPTSYYDEGVFDGE
ncbi:Aldo-keto reductase family 1 member C1 [Thelohanellus kitauei]|uniref:Aldo-keto reductase family 1 member C1 n=1 Tax=Thelohanellus kitauei TaxID=669202 RepID=A0A0C2MRZ9_THEKT|nr:Aldo-keto reductase family 1 member C1 [Thelohanellus kitauei]